MKHPILIALLITIILSSCKKDSINYQNDFYKSYQAFNAFKKESNNSYQYTVVGGSWVGPSWETTVFIQYGKVVARHFKYTGGLETLKKYLAPEALEWTENDPQLNIHSNTPAASTITLDEIYQTAKNDWLVRRKDTQTFFETKNNGMISDCGYIPNNCADDCFRGITITSIQKQQAFYW